MQKEEESLEPTTVFLAQPLTCSGPGTGDTEGIALAKCCPQRSQPDGKVDMKTDCSNNKAPRLCHDHASPPTHTHSSSILLCSQSRQRRTRPVRGLSLLGKMEVDRQQVTSLGGHYQHTTCGCSSPSPTFETRPLGFPEASPGDVSRALYSTHHHRQNPACGVPQPEAPCWLSSANQGQCPGHPIRPRGGSREGGLRRKNNSSILGFL